MDETEEFGDIGSADGGAGDPRDRTPVDGWATTDSSWSSAGAALDPSSDIPSWRRSSAELRTPPDFRASGEVGRDRLPHPGGDPHHTVGPSRSEPPAGLRPSVEAAPRDETGPGSQNATASRWSDSRSRYADLLAHLSPSADDASVPNGGVLNGGVPNSAIRDGAVPVRPPDPGWSGDAYRADRRHPDEFRPGPPDLRLVPGELSTGPTGPRPVSAAPRQAGVGGPRFPISAPPYPYEGDPDDAAWDDAAQDDAARDDAARDDAARDDASRDDAARDDAARDDAARRGPAQHAVEPPTPPEGVPQVGRPDQGWQVLPQRVPAEPDVPTVPEPPSVELPAETPALARIATHLRRGDVLPPQERQEGFDVTAILAAVREVAGVRGASLRTTSTGAHSLRLDLADGADPAEVSRLVARLLQDRMGLDAAVQPPDDGPTDELSSSAPHLPGQSAPISSSPGTAPGGYPSRGSAGTVTGANGMITPGGRVPTAGRGKQMRRPPTAGRGRAVVEDVHVRGTAEVTTSTPVFTTRLPTETDSVPPRPLIPGNRPGPRVVIENVQVSTFGLEATVQVRLTVGERAASGVATGPAVDGYLLRLCAMATASAVDELLAPSDHADGPARCFVEHAASVPFGASEVAVVVLLLSWGGWVEQLAGSSVVVGDDRHAIVRATLAAVNRRLEALLS